MSKKEEFIKCKEIGKYNMFKFTEEKVAIAKLGKKILEEQFNNKDESK